jgi:non-heme chloroperoxidase
MRNQHTIAGGGGLNLNVMEWGQADGPAIVFIHGWSQTYMTWMKQVESDLADRFRLVALDLRGHGMSDAPHETAAYTDSQLWADDVHAVIETLQLVRPVLVGWSYGGLVMTDYVRAFGDANIAGINFVGAAVQMNEAAIGVTVGPGFYENFEAATSHDLEESIDAMRRFIDQCFVAKLSRIEFERLLCWNMTVRPDVRAALAARDLDQSDALATITVPTLVTHGRKDITVLPAMAEFIADKCSTATLSWYDDVAHGPFIEDGERFNRELADFVLAVNA